MNITQLKKEIIKSIKINKDSIILNEKIDKKTVELLKFDYDDLTKFVLKCFKDYERGV
jgi:N-dimethylarginine dimethylaminohydrolase